MGFVFSRPVTAAAPPTPPPTLTIRNLTITPLDLTLVERLDHDPHLHQPRGPVRASSGISGRPRPRGSDAPPTRPSSVHEEEEPPSSARQEITAVSIQPFSECYTTVYPPDPTRHQQLRLTFEDSSTGHRYSAEIPSSSRRSIVLKSQPKGPEEEPKEFTAIYLPSHAFLALFSSANLSAWMSTLDPSLPLSSLSIPGTHNSPTHHVALPSVRCQVVSVLDQLNNGVRFLDVRVSSPVFRPPPSSSPTQPSGNDAAAPLPTPELSLVHSVFPISLTGPKHLSTLLTTLYTFLTTHPTETILLSLKCEGPPGPGRGTDADLSQILYRHYIAAHPQRWYTSPSIPTLSQSRGRIVLVRRFRLHPSIPPQQGGIDGSVWPDNVADGTCGSGTIRIQDYYGVARPDEIQRKVRYAQRGLERAAAQGVNGRRAGEEDVAKEAPLFINFLSASSFFNVSCWPDRIAVKVNPSMIEYLCMGHGAPSRGPGKPEIGDAATGIVVTDWVGHHGDWDLVRCIVGWNARLQLRQ